MINPSDIRDPLVGLSSESPAKTEPWRDARASRGHSGVGARRLTGITNGGTATSPCGRLVDLMPLHDQLGHADGGASLPERMSRGDPSSTALIGVETVVRRDDGRPDGGYQEATQHERGDEGRHQHGEHGRDSADGAEASGINGSHVSSCWLLSGLPVRNGRLADWSVPVPQDCCRK